MSADITPMECCRQLLSRFEPLLVFFRRLYDRIGDVAEFEKRLPMTNAE
jgi:hypothetical protein